MGTFSKVIAVVYLILALYLLNFKFNVVSLDFLASIEGWIMVAIAAILVIHAFRFFIKKSYSYSGGYT